MKTVADFAEAYRATWEEVMNNRCDVDALTPFFHVPCTMFDVNGEMTEYATKGDIAAFNVTRRDSFKDGGAVAATLQGVDQISVGPYLSLAIVNWDLKRADGSQERCWRHHYTLRKVESDLKILISTFDVGS